MPVGLQRDVRIAEQAEHVADVLVRFDGAEFAGSALRIRLPRLGWFVEEFRQAAVDDDTLARKRANRDRGIRLAGDGAIDLLAIHTAAEIQRVAGSQLLQGVIDRPPRCLLGSRRVVLASDRIYVKSWALDNRTLRDFRQRPQRRM